MTEKRTIINIRQFMEANPGKSLDVFSGEGYLFITPRVFSAATERGAVERKPRLFWMCSGIGGRFCPWHGISSGIGNPGP